MQTSLSPDLPWLSVVTTCKGRLHHLQQTLPLLMVNPGIEMIVVDFDCPDGTGSWVAANWPQVKLITVTGEAGFHHARARNLGAAQATAPWVLFIDADIRCVGDLFAWARQHLQVGAFYLSPRRDGSGLTGTHFVERQAYQRVEGFDEAIRDWGGVDEEMYVRLARSGITMRHYAESLFEEIQHGSEERFRFVHGGGSTSTQTINHNFYCSLKYDLMGILNRNLSLEERLSLKMKAAEAASRAGSAENPASAWITIDLGGRDELSRESQWKINRKLTYSIE